MPRDFQPVRPFGEFPPLEAKGFDTRTSTFIPDGSIDTSKVRELSVLRMRGIGAKIYEANAQTIAASATEATVSFDTTLFYEGMDAPASDLITIPYNGVYLLSANLEWAGAAGETFAWFYINSAKKEGHAQSDASSVTTKVALTTVRRMTAGDTVGVRVKQTNGVATRDIGGGEESCSLTVVFLFAI